MRWPSLRWPLHNGTSEAIWKRLENHGISWGGHMVKPWLTWVSYILAIENDQKPWFYHMILGGDDQKTIILAIENDPKNIILIWLILLWTVVIFQFATCCLPWVTIGFMDVMGGLAWFNHELWANHGTESIPCLRKKLPESIWKMVV